MELVNLKIFDECRSMPLIQLGVDITYVCSQGPLCVQLEKSPFAPSGEGLFLRNIYIVNRMIPVPDVTNSIPEHLAFVFSSVSMAATEVRLIFLEMGT